MRLTSMSRIPDLGTATWLADEFGEQGVIDVYSFSGHLVLCPLPIHGDMWWITMPHDHVSKNLRSQVYMTHTMAVWARN
jgi:hypothetical protein